MSIDVQIRHAFCGFALDVQFSIERPGITALFGPSGAGKTSVVNAIAGLLRPHIGRISLNGHTVFDASSEIFVPPRKRRVGYVFQNARLFPHMTVERNLRFGWRRAAARAPESELERILDMLELRSILHRRPESLSGGEKGRVALARALLASPDILLLDEPLAALDQARKSEILPYLEHLRDEAHLPMLYVSHSLDEVSRLADNVVLMRAGRSVASGPVFEVLTSLSFPELSGTAAFGTVLDARVAANDPEGGISLLEFDGGRLTVPLLPRKEGARLRVRIPAEDVMLALQEPQGISANNVLAATVAEIRAADTHADIRVVHGPAVLVARITRASLARLALAPGMQVFAIVKSVTVSPQIDAIGGPE